MRENPGYEMTRKTKRTAYDVNQIRSLLLEGKKKMEIEAITGLSKQQLATAMTRHNLDQYLKVSRGYPKEVHDKDREMIKELYDQGVTMGKIAKQIGRGEEYVRQRLKELPQYKTREQKRQETATKIRFMLLCGKTKREISDELGFSCTSLVSYYLNSTRRPPTCRRDELW